MRARLAIALALIAACGADPAAAAAPSFAGHWEGAYGRLGSIQLVRLDLVEHDGAFSGTFDVPELDLEREPIRAAALDSAGLELRLVYGPFTMRLSADGYEMTGGNRRWNPPLTLHLKRAVATEPCGPPRETMTFASGSVRLAGTLVLPATPGPHPAVAIVHGSGPQSRADGLYRRWGRFFARRGVAALIYDKRGAGESGGDLERATFDDLAGDALAAVRALAARGDVRADAIGLVGISQGGWVAPLAAARDSMVRFLILDAGPAVSVREQELQRVEYTLRANEFSATDVAAALAYVKEVFRAAYGHEGDARLFARAAAVKKRPWAAHVGVIESEADLDGWRLIRYDPAAVLRRTTVPLLALYGENDVLVPPAENVHVLHDLLDAAGNRDVTIRVIPGVGHDMETFGRLEGGRWDWPTAYWVWPRHSRAFDAAIDEWLAAHGLGR